MLRILLTVCLICALTPTALSQAKRPRKSDWLQGEWAGTGYQIDDGSTWAMRLNARGRSFTIEYPSLNCGGVWVLVRMNSRRAVFREKITSGRERCDDNGNIVLERLNARQIAYRFSRRGAADYTASAILGKEK